MTTEAQKKARRKYRKTNIRQFNLELNKKTDADVVKKLDQVENMQGYIKNLIKKDILFNPDGKRTEPLIKDEKIRKAVRAWAEANGASRAYIVDLGMLRDESSGNEIEFNGEPFVGWVTSLKTITELCGEEEE